uniref:Uncharacterized protein n=1 Tax=Tetranychus urticae TaxID=32264 RepID=T1L3X2_TETUR
MHTMINKQSYLTSNWESCDFKDEETIS